MPQCEMCGAEQSSLTTTKVEGAELDLCDDCTDFGTEVRTESGGSASTKYSTSSSGSSSASSSADGSGSSGGGGGTGGTGGTGGSSRRRDMFDDMDELATDYDERVRDARENRGLSQQELADELNEKTSLVRKIERGDVLPSDEMQGKLEGFLDVSLSEGTEDEDAEWSGGSSTTTTLGDVVKRKD